MIGEALADPFGPGSQRSSPRDSTRDSSPSFGSLLEPLPADKQIKLRFIQVSTSVPLPAAKGEGRKQILKNVSGSALPGELMALMGPSGAGKSSLLTVLCGRQPGVVRVEGSIKYNDRSLNEALRNKVAFVPQDDLLYANLSAEELLHFAAMVSMPKNMPKDIKLDLVEEAIQALGLQKCRTTPIRKTAGSVSGGERKRVAVACELLTNPAMMFLDEPTSGLDSTAALTLVKLLKDLASNGRGVVCTIHQPSTTLFSHFDKLMLISRGETLYYGQRSICMDWFTAGGSVCPYGVNVAEFIIDLAACAPQEDKTVDPSETRDNLVGAINKWMDSSSMHLDNGVTKEDVEMMPMLMKSVQDDEGLQFLPDSGSPLKPAPADPEDAEDIADLKQALMLSKAERVNWFVQFWLLYKRAIASRKFEVVSYQKFAMIIGWGIFAGLIWFAQGLNLTAIGVQNVSGLLWLLTLFQFNQGMLSSLYVFPPEIPVIIKDRQGGMYSLSAYYLARSVTELQLEMPFVILQNTIVYALVVLRPTVSAYLQILVISMLVSLTSQGLGQMIGTTIRFPKNVQLTSSFTIQWTLVTSGFLVVLPPFVDWFKYFSIMRYGYVAMSYVQFDGVTVEFCPGGQINGCLQLPWQTAVGGAANLTPPLWLDYILLVVFVLISRTLTFLVLYNRTAPKRGRK